MMHMFDATDDTRRWTLGDTTVVVLTTDTPLLGPDAYRTSLILPAPLTNRITYRPVTGPGQAAVLDQGITLYPAGLPLVLSAMLHGALVTYSWRGISAVAQQTIVIPWCQCHICTASRKAGESQVPYAESLKR